MTLTMQKIPMVETKNLRGAKMDSLPALEGDSFYMIGVNRRAIGLTMPSVIIEKVKIQNDKIVTDLNAQISPVLSVATIGGNFELTEIVDPNGDNAVRILTQSDLTILRANEAETNDARFFYIGC